MKLTPAQIQNYIAVGSTLVELGLATADKLRDIWAGHGVDETVLDTILADVDRRIARRATPAPQ